MKTLTKAVIALLVIGVMTTWSDEVTKTFIHGQNGYDGFTSVTIGSYHDEVDSTDDIGEKMMLDYWINNAASSTNSLAACISDMIC